MAPRSDNIDPPADVPPGLWLYLQTIYPDEAPERGRFLTKLFKELAADDEIDLPQVHRALIREIEDRVWTEHQRHFDETIQEPARAAARRARHYLKLAAGSLRELLTTSDHALSEDARAELRQMSDDDLIDNRGVLTFQAGTTCLHDRSTETPDQLARRNEQISRMPAGSALSATSAG